MAASVEVVAKREKALELRKSGLSYPKIAENMGCSVSTAHGYVQSALKETIQEPADEVRVIELERLDIMIRSLWPTVLAGSPSEKRNAIDRVILLMDRRAKYLGLDAPQRRIVEVVTEDELTKVLKELEREIEAMEGDGQVEGELVEA